MSAFDTVSFYNRASWYLYAVGGPILIIFGTAGGFICLYVFGQKSMRKNAASIYFIALNTSNILLLWTVLFSFVYSRITDFELANVNLFYCRLRTYLLDVLLLLSPYYLVLASFDRILVTSRNAVTRRKSTARLALLLTAITTVLWFVYYFHNWMFVYIQYLAPGISFCFYQPGVYSVFMGYSSVIVGGFLPLSLMSIFSIVTVKNFRKNRVHMAQNALQSIRLSSKDGQLIVMLLTEISIYVGIGVLASLLFGYTQRLPDEAKTVEQQALDYFLLDLSLCIKCLLASLNCYSNLAVSKTFRKGTLSLMRKIIPQYCHHYIQQEQIARTA